MRFAKLDERIRVRLKLLGWTVNKRLRQSVRVATKQGIFTVRLSDGIIGPSLYVHGEYELPLMSEAVKILRSLGKLPPKGGGTIVDVGANNGITAIGLLHMGELARAIAFEPEPDNFCLLQQNVAQNYMEERILCLPYAVSNRQGEAVLELSDSNFGDHRVRMPPSRPERYQESRRRTVSVRCDRLDNLLADLPASFTDDIALLWVDVQGHEGYVFTGARELLSRGIPVVSEIWPYGILRAGMSPEEFFRIAEDLWTHYWVLRQERLISRPIETLRSLFDELGVDGAHDNVIFTS